MNRNQINLLFLSLLILAGCSSTKKKEDVEIKSPNVIFIAIDDLRSELGCYGNEVIQTLNLDKLASSGTAFTNHFVQVPTCGASRFSLLTGRRPTKMAHLKNDAIEKEISDLPESEMPESFVHHLRRNGYYTVGSEKSVILQMVYCTVMKTLFLPKESSLTAGMRDLLMQGNGKQVGMQCLPMLMAKTDKA